MADNKLNLEINFSTINQSAVQSATAALSGVGRASRKAFSAAASGARAATTQVTALTASLQGSSLATSKFSQAVVNISGLMQIANFTRQVMGGVLSPFNEIIQNDARFESAKRGLDSYHDKLREVRAEMLKGFVPAFETLGIVAQNANAKTLAGLAGAAAIPMAVFAGKGAIGRFAALQSPVGKGAAGAIFGGPAGAAYGNAVGDALGFEPGSWAHIGASGAAGFGTGTLMGGPWVGAVAGFTAALTAGVPKIKSFLESMGMTDHVRVGMEAAEKHQKWWQEKDAADARRDKVGANADAMMKQVESVEYARMNVEEKSRFLTEQEAKLRKSAGVYDTANWKPGDSVVGKGVSDDEGVVAAVLRRGRGLREELASFDLSQSDKDIAWGPNAGRRARDIEDDLENFVKSGALQKAVWIEAERAKLTAAPELPEAAPAKESPFRFTAGGSALTDALTATGGGMGLGAAYAAINSAFSSTSPTDRAAEKTAAAAEKTVEAVRSMDTRLAELNQHLRAFGALSE